MLIEDAHPTISATFLVEPAHEYRVLVYAVRSSLYPLAGGWEKDGVEYELSAEVTSAPLRVANRRQPNDQTHTPLLWERQRSAGGTTDSSTPTVASENASSDDSGLTLEERWSNVLIKRALAFGQVSISQVYRSATLGRLLIATGSACDDDCHVVWCDVVWCGVLSFFCPSAAMREQSNPARHQTK